MDYVEPLDFPELVSCLEDYGLERELTDEMQSIVLWSIFSSRFKSEYEAMKELIDHKLVKVSVSKASMSKTLGTLIVKLQFVEFKDMDLHIIF